MFGLGSKDEDNAAGVVPTKVYTLCGSSRFPDAFHLVNAHLSMKGHVVISLGLFGHADQPMGAKFLTSDGNEMTKEKQSLDKLHYKKIDMSDSIFVINVGGYIGSSTKREIAYARSLGKGVEYLFDEDETKTLKLSGEMRTVDISKVHPDNCECGKCWQNMEGN